ncbi:MAG: AMP-binding protein [Actinobacteria bacterium]|nr:AMP-binding protein [Actinomycetota bacterium]
MSPAPDPLSLHAEARGGTIAVTVDGSGGAQPSATSFDELNRGVNRLAHGLRSLGTVVGERLVWCGPNSLEVIAAIHAARKNGLVAVPLSYRFNGDEMAYVIDNSDAVVVVTDSEQADAIASMRDRCPNVREIVVFDALADPPDTPPGCLRFDELLASQPDNEPEPPDASVAGAQMLYTSGTTGKPKGALRTTSDRAIVFALLTELGLPQPDDVHLTTGPLYHSGPLAFASLAHTLGAPIVVLRRFDPRAWLRLVAEHSVTNTFSAPTQLKRIVALPDDELAAADMSSMRCLIANAAPVPYPLKQEIVAKLGDGFLFEVYGSTELGIVTVLKPADQLRKPGSCGQTYGGVGVRIVTDDGVEAAPGEPGELFISTGLAMDGYHRTDEQLTALSPQWKSVGDVAYSDDEGYLYICDRKKDMIISGGVNIYPAEIEAVIHAHAAVLDVAVFGIPDDEWGESVYAIVQPRAGTDIDIEELRRFVDARVAGYKRPRAYEVRAELPRTDAGKLLKRVLRDEFWRDRTTRV